MTNAEGMLAMIGERASALEQLRGAVLRCNQVFGPSFWTTEHELTVVAARAVEPEPIEAIETPAAPRATRRVASVVAPAGKGRPKGDAAAIDEAVFAELRRGLTQGKPIAKAMKISVLAVREALQRLTASGRVSRQGAGRHVQFLLPGAARPVKASRPSMKGDARDAAMLAFLGQQAAPVSPRDLIAAMGVSAVPVQQSIKRLVAAGTVVVSGATLNRRIGVPRVMGTQPKSTPAASATPRESKPAVDNSTLRRLEGEITRVLRSGASYDTRELRRNISAAFPTIALEDIDAACADMARAGAVERIRISERLTRYRLYPKRKADD